MKKTKLFLLLSAIGICASLSGASALASVVNLTHPDQSTPLSIHIDSQRSAAYGWRPGDSVVLEIYSVDRLGERDLVADANGISQWTITLNENAEARVDIPLGANVHTGSLSVFGNNKSLFRVGETLSTDGTYWTEKLIEHRLADGVVIRVHYTDQAIHRYDAEKDLPNDVLDAAVHAYQTITDFQGFGSSGYSFANADPTYAADPDKTIDVYLGDPSGQNAYPELGMRNNLFKDAPCFDTLKLSDTQYQAVILLPVNYREFIRNWEKINPSPLGRRNIRVDLRGTLIHEMLHVIIFYYNKNLNKSSDSEGMYGSAGSKDLDWYVEGLARYFETFAGARHDFYSQGFKQTLPDKIRFSRGGSNYFMRYPDQAFTQLRYENALFWRYLDDRYGMQAIEELSRDLRREDADFMSALERMTKVPFVRLLTDYAKAILLKDFGLKDDSVYLNEVARCRLQYKNDEWFLVGGEGRSMRLGRVCETDWIGAWESVQVDFPEASAAGDNTRIADVSGWATDYIELSKDAATAKWPTFAMRHTVGEGGLVLQVLGQTKGGSYVEQSLPAVRSGEAVEVRLNEIIRSSGLLDQDIDRFYIMITNTDRDNTSEYSLNLLS